MAKKRSILVTNDDGVSSPGIRALVEVAREFGEVKVVAPDSPQSGKGHSITLDGILRMQPVDLFDGVEAYKCSGTPTDCVKLAVNKVFDDKPDFCFSGINHGSNEAINVIYSGTMAAAMEASFLDIKSIGFSHLNYRHGTDMLAAQKFAAKIIQMSIEKGFPASNLLNVNFPDLPESEIKGVKICRQANASWDEEFDERESPFGRKYYWLTGKFVNTDLDEEADTIALKNGYVSVVPVQRDLTSYSDMKKLKDSWN